MASRLGGVGDIVAIEASNPVRRTGKIEAGRAFSWRRSEPREAGTRSEPEF